MSFKVGDYVYKYKGSYCAYGYIVAAFTTRDNAERYVFEFERYPGMLHIFTGDQLELQERQEC